jgi:hypothetical protein
MASTTEQQMNDERLVSRTFPDRRVATADRRVDFDPTVPNRRATDRREMDNALIRQDFKHSERRFTGESVTDWSKL